MERMLNVGGSLSEELWHNTDLKMKRTGSCEYSGVRVEGTLMLGTKKVAHLA
jgi:hypothetical protein